MIVSLNEIETTCYRAALGAGLSHGLAEDAAAIAARLAVSGSDGLAVMLRALRFADRNRTAPPVFRRDGKSFRPAHPVLPSLIAGPAAADLKRAMPDAEIDTSGADEPRVIAACLSDAPLQRPAGTLEADNRVWQELRDLAARTYVAASLQSRLMGAGAGLHDND